MTTDLLTHARRVFERKERLQASYRSLAELTGHRRRTIERTLKGQPDRAATDAARVLADVERALHVIESNGCPSVITNSQNTGQRAGRV